MYIKKLKRKCSVRGCRCTDTFAISLTREIGNTVIICKSCLGKALGAIDGVQDVQPARVSHTEAPSLFFNRQALGLAPVKAVEPEAVEPEGFECPVCGKVCKSALGLQKHIDSVHKEES